MERIKIEMDFSIIIPALISDDKKFTMVKDCVSSAMKYSTHNPEIIVVTNSKDNIGWFVRAGCKVLTLEDGFNFSKSVNAGINASQGKHLVILNDDTEIQTEDWLVKMRRVFDSKNHGAVSAYFNNGASGNVDLWESHYQNNATKETGVALNMICVMIKREVYNHIGDLDENFVGYGGEDIDYSLRLVVAGYKLGIANVKVKHHRGQSFAVKDSSQPAKYFQEKWNCSLGEQGMRLDTSMIGGKT